MQRACRNPTWEHFNVRVRIGFMLVSCWGTLRLLENPEAHSLLHLALGSRLCSKSLPQLMGSLTTGNHRGSKSQSQQWLHRRSALCAWKHWNGHHLHAFPAKSDRREWDHHSAGPGHHKSDQGSAGELPWSTADIFVRGSPGCSNPLKIAAW